MQYQATQRQHVQHKERAVLSAHETASRLRDLADAIELGRLLIRDTIAPVAQSIEFEQEHGRQELTIELEWAVPTE